MRPSYWPSAHASPYMDDNDEPEYWADTSFTTDPIYAMLQMKYVKIEAGSEAYWKWIKSREVPLHLNDSVIELDPDFEAYVEREVALMGTLGFVDREDGRSSAR